MSGRRKKFTIGNGGRGWEDGDIMMVGGKGGVAGGGRILFFKKSGNVRALRPLMGDSRKLSRGNHDPGVRPVSKDGLPIAEVLLLAALRPEACTHDRALALWRLQEESEEALEAGEHPSIAGSPDKYHAFVGDWLAVVAARDGSKGLRRVADWMDFEIGWILERGF